MRLFEFIYYIGYRINSAYDLKRQKRLPAKVISVGNITTGGTGKTPLTMAIAKEAVKRGYRPIILTRGYKGKAEGVVNKNMSERDAGDEALLMALKLPEITVIKGKDRYKSGMGAMPPSISGIAASEPPLFILDDGFQHRKLFRDKDILLINARAPFDNGKLLPTGRLREPKKEIRRADVIVITKSTGNIQPLKDEIGRYNPDAPIFTAKNVPSHVVSYEKGVATPRPVNRLSGKAVYAFCGIADPDSFKSDLEGAGAKVLGLKAYGDHYRYNESDVKDITEAAKKCGAEWIITTEKDIIRLKLLSFPDKILSLSIEISVGEGFYDEAFKF